MKTSNSFAIQIDKSTGVSGQAQLVSFVRYIDVDEINEHILFCKKLEQHTIGEAIFNVINQFFSEQVGSEQTQLSLHT